MSASDREIRGEVTRVEAVKYLQGSTGHGLGSLGLLAVGAIGLWATSRVEIGIGALVAAGLVSINGLSLFAWDSIRDYVESRAGEHEDSGQSRTIAPPSMSVEQKAEMVASLVQMLVLVAILFAAIEMVLLLGIRTGAYLLGGVIAVGNLGALVLAHWPMADDE